MPGMKWPFRRDKREPGWLAVSLQPGELSFVHGQITPGGAATVDVCGTHMFEGDFEAAQQGAREHDLGRYQCSTLLSPGEYQVLLVEAPNVPQAELKTAIRWRIKDLLDYHVNDATVDVLSVPPNPGGGNERNQCMPLPRAMTSSRPVSAASIARAFHLRLSIFLKPPSAT